MSTNRKFVVHSKQYLSTCFFLKLPSTVYIKNSISIKHLHNENFYINQPTLNTVLKNT